MEYAKELVANFDQESCNFGLSVCLFMFGMLCICVYFSFCFEGVIAQFTQVALLLFAFLYFMGLVQGLIIKKTKLPALVVKKDGIYVRRFGFICWSDIRKISRYHHPIPSEAISVFVYDIEKLKKQATFTGKISLLSSKIFDTPHIYIFGLDKSVDEVLVFAHRHYKVYTDNT